MEPLKLRHFVITTDEDATWVSALREMVKSEPKTSRFRTQIVEVMPHIVRAWPREALAAAELTSFIDSRDQPES